MVRVSQCFQGVEVNAQSVLLLNGYHGYKYGCVARTGEETSLPFTLPPLLVGMYWKWMLNLLRSCGVVSRTARYCVYSPPGKILCLFAARMKRYEVV